MKYSLILIVKLYWFLIPKNKRRKCIFKESCSKFVYEETSKNGFNSGIKAFLYRYNTCRAGFEIYTNPISGEQEMLLLNGEIIRNKEIAERLLTN
ncbi:membrane protein insertion efficiency factor YidD [Flavobacterium sp.]|uniref:membrane protein insertion efficiency factor YidD n=1 Tax=Flavobacterium sp. TaxID=239 RepID=UPI0035276638